MANNEARFSIKIDGNVKEVADKDADALVELNSSIEASKGKIGDLSSTMRLLKGRSEEVVAEKKRLQAAIDAERNSLTRAGTALAKQGIGYADLSKAIKGAAAAQTKSQEDKLAAEKQAEGLAQKERESAAKRDEVLRGKAEAMAEKARATQDRINEREALSKEKASEKKAKAEEDAMAKEKASMEKMRDAAQSSNAAIAKSATGMALAYVAALGAIGVAFAKFAAESANAARTANLFRQAATGNAQNATNFGQQIDLLSSKVSTGRAELNALGNDMAKSGIQGQVLVDTLNATAQANDALGNDAGAKLRSLVEAGRISGRLGGVNPLESLLGTGIDFNDLASSVAKGMKVTVGEAKSALVEGRVPLGAGAEAIRKAVEGKLGQINARKMLDLNVQAAKLQEKFAMLTEGVNLEPLLKGFDSLVKVFDTSTVTGATLKNLITTIGNGLGPTIEKVTPIAKAFLTGMIIAGLKVATTFLVVKRNLVSIFGSDAYKNVDGITTAMNAAKVAMYGLAGAAALIGVAFTPFIVVGKWIADAVRQADELWGAIKKGDTYLRALDWGKLGEDLVNGLAGGITKGAKKVVEAVKGLATSAKDMFTGEMKIQSPSKVMEDYGYQLPAGAAVGVEKGTAKLDSAVKGMASSAPGSAGGKGGAAVNVNVTIHANGSDAPMVQSPAFLSGLTKAIEDALLGAGVVT